MHGHYCASPARTRVRRVAGRCRAVLLLRARVVAESNMGGLRCALVLLLFRPVGAGVPPSELAALRSLYEATKGSQWKNNTGWFGGGDPCLGWYGVGCNADGSAVTTLALSRNVFGHTRGNGISGTLPTQLADLTELGYLDLESNALSGTIVTEIGKLTQLVHLGLSHNALSGTIVTELGKLTQLGDLVLSYNALSGTLVTEIGLSLIHI